MTYLGKMAGLAALVLLGAGVEAPAQAPASPALAALEPGLWELKDDAPNTQPSRICITDARQLLQPLQPAPLCKQFVSENGGDYTAASYDCAARGQGRTKLRVETPRLAQIDSQGIAGGRPFALRVEARRVGACTAAMR